MTTSLTVVHPFPARMAPEVARHAVELLRPGSRLLDPMCGSGTALRLAVENGIEAVGMDIDPLSVLMSSVWSNPPHVARLLHDANLVVENAKALGTVRPELDWHDAETGRFAAYWFAEPQLSDLHRLAFCISRMAGSSREALMLALSRIVITKDHGASLARDVSHSRPHRVMLHHSYEVVPAFARSVRDLAKRLEPHAVRARSSVELGDARDLSPLPNGSFDCVVTSPPYLNAIDYLRGHRLALIWLGYSVAQTQAIRSVSVGVERGIEGDSEDVLKYTVPASEATPLPPRQVGWLRRYAADAARIVGELTRVVRPGGHIVLVIGNSYLRGCRIDNARLFGDLLESAGTTVQSLERIIPARRRYLPLPGGDTGLASRMRSEVVLTAKHPAV